nr:MAG TPA: tail tape measure [Caudoviricetes sp.]
MAKYVIDTELNNRALSAGIKGINQQMNSLTRSARDFNKEFEKSGKGSDKKKALQDMAQAISLADEKVKKLSADLSAMQAKGNIKGIAKAEADLRNAQTQARNLRREFESMGGKLNENTGKFDKMKKAISSAMDSRPVHALKNAFSGLGNVAQGSVKGAVAGVKGLVKVAQTTVGALTKMAGAGVASFGLLGKSAMNTYDEMARGSRAMGNSLTDGAEGAKVFQDSIKALGSAGLADMGSLTDIAKNLSASIQMSGKEAFDMATGILDIGTAFGMSKDKIESFGLVSSQIFSAGKLMAEDYNQLIDAGAAGPIKKWIAGHNNAGITMENFKEKINDGAVTVDLYKGALNALGTEFKGAGQDVNTFGDAFENARKTLDMSFIEGMKKEFGDLGFSISDSANAMGSFAEGVAEASVAFLGGAWSTMQPVIEQLSTSFDGLNINMASVARGMSVDLFTAIANLIPNFEQIKVLSDFLSGAWYTLSNLLIDITALISDFVNGLMVGAGWLDSAGNSTNRLNDSFNVLNDAISILYQGLQPLISLLGEIVGVIINVVVQVLDWANKTGFLKGVLDLLTVVVRTVWGAIKSLASGFLEVTGLTNKNSEANKALANVVKFLKSAWDALSPALILVANAIGKVIGNIFNIISAIVNWMANSKALQGVIEALGNGLKWFVNMASGFLDTIIGIANAVANAWNAIFNSADEQDMNNEFTYKVSTDIDDEPDPFAGLGDIQYFTKASGVMDALKSAMGSFRGATMASNNNTGNTYGDVNITIDGAQNPNAIMGEFKAVMRKNGYNLRYN